MQSIEDIERKIGDGSAVVMTASELKSAIRGGEHPEPDVVTCGTFGVMSGTMAILSIPVCGPDVFRRADSITINGVPATPGPCPNESLGLVDCVVYGTSHRDDRYGGGHLFRDLVAGLPVEVRVMSDGACHASTVTLSDMGTARMVLTRGAFMNYTGFVNPDRDVRTTIFSGPAGMPGGLSCAAVSGCGEINPLQNDPGMRHVRTGTPAMVNGARGMVIGTGTRSTPSKPNLSVTADMKGMDPTMMGGFVTSAGPECLTSVAVAIPVTDRETMEDLGITDDAVPLPLADVRDRVPVDADAYSSVWRGTWMCDISCMDDCSACAICAADAACPVDAKPSTRCGENTRCMRCGICASACVRKRFDANLGYITFKGTEVPIGIRQSDRVRGEELCLRLKRLVAEGEWKLEM